MAAAKVPTAQLAATVPTARLAATAPSSPSARPPASPAKSPPEDTRRAGLPNEGSRPVLNTALSHTERPTPHAAVASAAPARRPRSTPAQRADDVRKLVAQITASLQQVQGHLRAVRHVPSKDGDTVLVAFPGLPRLSELPQAGLA